MSLLIYGATGYTGQLISALACEWGLDPILAGRNRDAVHALAESLGARWRVADLHDARGMDALMDGVRVVLHCAGPFVHTSALMVDACIRHRAHYLDITGEIGVFEACAARDREAREAGILLMPGVGFDVVPSDCLAAHLALRLPDATSLSLGFRALGGVSRGTALTMVEGLGSPGCIRVNGRLTPVPPAFHARTIDFGDGPRLAVTIPWGDVSTAYHSTGIPNIRVYMSMHPKQHAMLRRSRYLGWILRQPWVKRRAAARIRAGAPGPSPSARASGVSLLWGEAVAPDGRVAVSRLRAPEGYTLTAETAVRFAARVMRGGTLVGFQTPSRAFGADCILEVPGVTRTDDPLSTAEERA